MECKLLRLEITDDRAETAVRDPALSALVRDGWTVGAEWMASQMEGDGNVSRQFLCLMMVPPDPLRSTLVQLGTAVTGSLVSQREAAALVASAHASGADEARRTSRLLVVLVGLQVFALGVLMIAYAGWTL